MRLFNQFLEFVNNLPEKLGIKQPVRSINLEMAPINIKPIELDFSTEFIISVLKSFEKKKIQQECTKLFDKFLSCEESLTISYDLNNLLYTGHFLKPKLHTSMHTSISKDDLKKCFIHMFTKVQEYTVNVDNTKYVYEHCMFMFKREFLLRLHKNNVYPFYIRQCNVGTTADPIFNGLPTLISITIINSSDIKALDRLLIALFSLPLFYKIDSIIAQASRDFTDVTTDSITLFKLQDDRIRWYQCGFVPKHTLDKVEHLILNEQYKTRNEKPCNKMDDAEVSCVAGCSKFL
ncbi:hypothetical protein BIY23_03640 [Wolbachia pipientis]|uniref:Uncharacterized protein n=1 Tax=Wolbachia pipientis TaxID=955 RepID=A0A1E7QJ48_WOLPI|nr:hypothetical protein [Wolbachia pipientis]OEY86493.1 hypothetical protein BIY23_03640 [Wolbachia pipientis]